MYRHVATRFGLSLTLVAGLFAAGLALATSHGMKELDTATEHAGFAAKADTLKKHRMHLQHVVNCLVGERGKGFDDSVGNPCNGMGKGAIHDMEVSETAARMLKQAAKLAHIGTRIESAEAAGHVAQAVEALLQEAKQQSAAKF